MDKSTGLTLWMPTAQLEEHCSQCYSAPASDWPCFRTLSHGQYVFSDLVPRAHRGPSLSCSVLSHFAKLLTGSHPQNSGEEPDTSELTTLVKLSTGLLMHSHKPTTVCE